MAKRADRVVRLLDWETRHQFEYISDETLRGDDGMESLIRVLNGLSGEHENDDIRRTVRALVFGFTRQSNETLVQFVLRRENERSVAEALGVKLPSIVLGIMLEEGANLNHHIEASLRTLTAGALDAESVAKALRNLDIDKERLAPTSV